jgi:hypothetical protein
MTVLVKQVGEVRAGKSSNSSDQEVHIGAPEIVTVGRGSIARLWAYSNVDEIADRLERFPAQAKSIGAQQR